MVSMPNHVDGGNPWNIGTVWSDDEEFDIQKKLFEAGTQGAAVYGTYIRSQKWYEGKANLTKAQACTAMTKHTRTKMEDNKKGIQVMSCALNATPPRPLMHARRDREGLCGQKIGTITTDPVEVDSIATRAWRAIYHGNQTDLVGAVADF